MRDMQISTDCHDRRPAKEVPILGKVGAFKGILYHMCGGLGKAIGACRGRILAAKTKGANISLKQRGGL